jgi:GntR family transcriptional regulator / MocR family aminotransferase
LWSSEVSWLTLTQHLGVIKLIPKITKFECMKGTNLKPSDRANAASATPLRLQIYRQLRQAIANGTFSAGSKLPPSRDHAKSMGVARNSLLWALDRLKAEGYIHTRVGDGTYVANVARMLPAERHHDLRHAASTSPGISRRGQAQVDAVRHWPPPVGKPMAFRVGYPALNAFPFQIWDRLTRQAQRQHGTAMARYIAPAGYPPLQEAISQWLLVSRGIRCDAAQIIVVSGSQQALDLVGRLLLDPGDEVLVEDPGYQGIRACLMGHGAVARPVPLDADGMDIGYAGHKWPQARMAVVTPSWQFPAGVHMGLGRRLAVLAWARQHHAWVVEDDYDGEFQYLPHRTPALSSLDESGSTIHIGTFSKSLHPGLRIGFIVAPDGLVDAFTAAKVLADRHNPALEQAVLAHFIADGHLLRHLQRMRSMYAERQQIMIDALNRATHGAIHLLPSLRGIHLVHEIAPGADDASLVVQAKAAGVHLVALSAFCMASPRRGWALGYAAYDAEEMQSAAKRLAKLIHLVN